MSYNEIPEQKSIETTQAALLEKKYAVEVVSSAAEALESIKKAIPADASVMNGSSVTLEQIGFVEYLKSNEHSWNNLHATIVAEEDQVQQQKLRQAALHAEYYLGSVHALTETGEMMIASNTGSQLPHLAFTSQNLIIAVGAQKIVPTLDDAFSRLTEYVVPLEEDHMQQKYGVGTQLNKILIVKNESTMTNRNVQVILVTENLGF